MHLVPPPSWLKTAAFYQVYPQSFLDTNGDGIGDLPGIIAKLDYIKSIGCDAIWLNPCFDSPFGDAGYDVRDFYKVASRYGSNDDLENLFQEAHRRGMRVILDLVAGHTSIEHPWFIASAKAKASEYSERYLWTPRVWTTGEGPWIAGYAERDGCFQPNFFWFQPALNYGHADPDPKCPWQLPTHHPSCRKTLTEMENVMRYWLERGCDGFRVDMAESLIRGEGEARQKALQELWHRVRSWWDRDFPEAVLLSEWSCAPEAIDAGFHVDFMIHFRTPAYTSLFRNHNKEHWDFFEKGPSYFNSEAKGDIFSWFEIWNDFHTRTQKRGYISLPTGNHDIPPRLANGRNLDEQKCAVGFLLTLPGVPTIYYGDEIGMNSTDGLASKEGAYNRTGVRTPMQWDGGPNAGFSTATAEKCYLPVPESSVDQNVAQAEQDPHSLLNFVRDLLALRRAHPALGADGEMQPIFEACGNSGYPFIYRRIHSDTPDESFIIVINPSAKSCCATIPTKGELRSLKAINTTIPPTPTKQGTVIQIGPAAFAIIQESGGQRP